jgi:RNA polymerase sigma-70 factor, ECF subfamily
MSSLSAVSSLSGAMIREESSCFEAFQRELDYLSRTLRRLGVRTEDVEDHLQEIFLVLNRKWDEYDRARPLRPYLFGIAFRIVSAHRRKTRLEVPGDVEEFEADREDGPFAALEAARARSLVLRALARVPLPRRAVLVMHDIDEIPMREIVSSLSLPLFTGYSRLRKAREDFETAVLALQKGSAKQ